jgi:transcriptional regulator with XRE-family HTH domain
MANQRTARAFFAKELKRAREAKGLSQASAAKAIFVSASLVGMWETAQRLPRSEDLAHLEEVVGTGGFLSRLLEELVSHEVPPEWLGKWLALEAQASSLLSFEAIVIPGLLQTEDYARAVLRLGKQTPFGMEDQVTARLERQRVLERGSPPLFHAVLDEAVIRRPVGGPKVMHDQLTRLTALSERPEIIIQVIPFDVGAHAGFAGPVVLASFDGTEVAYVDNALRGEVVEKPEEVAAIRRLWQLLSSTALPEQASTELIEEAADSWTT